MNSILYSLCPSWLLRIIRRRREVRRRYRIMLQEDVKFLDP